MAVDATMRPLQIPPKFVPYFETHNIFYMFYAMCRYLLQSQPDDILHYMKKQFLEFHRYRKVTRRINFIAPDHLDMEQFSKELAHKIEGVVIKLDSIVELYNIKKNDVEPIYNPKVLAKATKDFITKNVRLLSWILLGFPRTKAEARALQEEGIMVSHTFELCHTSKDYAVHDLWNETLQDGTPWTYDTYRKMLINYKRRARELRDVFKATYKKIIIRGRRREQIINDCSRVLKQPPYMGAPMLPRVVLIGPRGSRRRILAEMLSKRFKLVHVNYQCLLARGGTRDNTMGELIRNADEFSAINIDICLKLLEERFLENDCQTYGWVLTGFPNDETDFRFLDSISTPPNRVVILNVCNEPCLDRIKDRLMNVHTGEVMSRKNNENNYAMMKELALHPYDSMNLVLPDQERYTSEITDLLDYCEHRALFVDASGPIAEVFEQVEKAVVYPQLLNILEPITKSESLYNTYLMSDTHLDQFLSTSVTNF